MKNNITQFICAGAIRPISRAAKTLIIGLLGVWCFGEAVGAGTKDPYPAPRGPFYDLVRDGKAASCIVVTPRASSIETFAANEIAACIKKMSGATFEILNAPKPGLRSICLGAAARDRLPPGRLAALGNDGFLLKSDAQAVLIAGSQDDPKRLGTLFGAYHFLEKHLGVRWFMPGKLGEVVPKRASVQVGSFDESETPSFRLRWVHGGDWALRNKMNVQVVLGGQSIGVKWHWHYHTFYLLIPPDKYYRSHPEWFSLLKGVRKEPVRDARGTEWEQGTQLCTSNPQLIEEVARNIIRVFDADPTIDILALGPQDGGGFCECESCRALDEERPPHERWHAQASNRLAVFNNEVARRVARKYPDKLIKVGAYAEYVRAPANPGFRSEPNLAVQVCHTYSCNNHPVAPPTCSANEKCFRRELERWAGLAKHLFIYEYYFKGAWGGLPYAQAHVIRHDIPYYHQLGAEGFYTQAPQNEKAWFVDGPNHYLAAKLIWDKDLDVDRLLADFYETFYGEAAAPMRRYHETVERAFRQWNQCMEPYGIWCPNLTSQWATLAAPEIFTPQILWEMEAAVSEAEKAATDPAVRERVRHIHVRVEFTRKCMDYLRTVQSPFKGIDLTDAKAVNAAHARAKTLGEPLSAELRRFCKDNEIWTSDQLIGAHQWRWALVPKKKRPIEP